MKINNANRTSLLRKLKLVGACCCAILFSGLVSLSAFMTMYSSNSDAPTKIGRALSNLASRIFIGSSIVDYLAYISPQQLVITFFIFVALLCIALSMISGHTKFFRFCYRKRYWIVITVLFMSISLNLNGSSLSIWGKFLSGAEQYKPIWGSAKQVRSDEWAVWSTFTISQWFSGWPAVSQAMAGGNISTLWISIGGIPALNLAIIFKPLYWGFLLLGIERGFSFLWTLRLLLLFFVSFELAMRYTAKKPWLSFCAAMVITFAPYVQWWNSQSIAEVLIFSQGMLLCLYSYVNTSSRRRRIFIAILLAYCLGCYVMIAYASWLISTLYVVLTITIVILVRNRNRLVKADIPTLLLPVGIVAAYLLVIALSDTETLNAIRNSIYPGSRLITGGDFFQTANNFTGLYSLFFPFIQVPFDNTCELSNFLTFAPAGLILTCYTAFKTKKKDALSIALIILEVFCLYFLIVGVPAAFAKVTLLSQCSRMNVALGLADIILLFRSLSQSKGMPALQAVVCALVSTALNMILFLRFYQTRKLILFALIVLYITIFFLLYHHQYDKALRKRILTFALTCLMLSAGAFVNPIQQGIKCVTETNLVKTLVSIENTSDDIYLVEGSFPMTNAPLLAGKTCFDSTQVYPNTKKWEKADPTGQYSDIYNRFCHISLSLIKNETRFILRAEDSIAVNFCFDDLETYGIHYLITTKEYSTISEYQFTLIGEADEWNIYQITYPTLAS